jgi:uncharacterized protein YdiU (UPF0061 family)
VAALRARIPVTIMPGMTHLDRLRFDNSYAALGEGFHSPADSAPFPDAYLVSFNPAAAELIGLAPEAAADPRFLEVFSGQQRLDGMQPVAALYAGHQFGVYVPQLGDGRAHLLGEVVTPEGGWELQLKGAGPTAYSRGADGRAVLRSTIREYLCSEAMHGLGIPTTRALAILGSDMPVYREGVESAAILVRMAASHLRFGNFEVFYHRGQADRLRSLTDYAIDRYFPELREEANPYLALLQAVITRTAGLLAQWQAVGFAHGVMNSDNMSLLGLTIDYGPFGFMDGYDPGFVCNHSDHRGRYAFERQPSVALWNLGCLAHALLPLIDPREEAAAEQAREALEQYGPQYGAAYAARMQAKLGLSTREPDDAALLRRLLDLMRGSGVDYTLFFRALCGFTAGPTPSALRDQFLDREGFDAWAGDYQARLAREQSSDAERAQRMRSANPKYVLRNHLAEIAIARAVAERDFSEVDRLLALLARPYDEQPEHADYADPPPDWAAQIRVSCSS